MNNLVNYGGSDDENGDSDTSSKHQGMLGTRRFHGGGGDYGRSPHQQRETNSINSKSDDGTNYEQVQMDLSEEDEAPKTSTSQKPKQSPDRDRERTHRPYSRDSDYNDGAKQRDRRSSERDRDNNRRSSDRDRENNRRSNDKDRDNRRSSDKDRENKRSTDQVRGRDNSRRSNDRERDRSRDRSNYRDNKDDKDRSSKDYRGGRDDRRDSRAADRDKRGNSHDRGRDSRDHNRRDNRDGRKDRDKDRDNCSNNRDRDRDFKDNRDREYRDNKDARDRGDRENRQRENRRRSPINLPSNNTYGGTYRGNKRFDRASNKMAQLEKLGIEIKAPENFVPPASGIYTPDDARGNNGPGIGLSGNQTDFTGAGGLTAGISGTGGGDGQFFMPGVTGRFRDQIERRKQLWAKSKLLAEPTPAPQVQAPKASPITNQANNPSGTSTWAATTFAQDTDGRQASKFKRLMGIKGQATGAAAGGSGGGGDEAMPNKRQEEMFNSMEAQYEVARTATHTMRGVGLGFSSATQGLYQR